MILLARQTSELQKILEVIVRRLPRTYNEYFNYNEHLRRIKAGFAGEQRVDAEWQELDLPSPHYILHDFQVINHAGSTHQMDTIFLCPHFLLILEIKNITGILSYDASFAQFIRTTADGTVEAMSDPFQQLERHVAWMKRLIQQERLSLPILHAVVLATKNGILTEDFKRQPIFHVTGLRSRMQKWLELHQPSVKKGEDLFRFANLLLTMHTRVKREINVPLRDIVKGVLCTNCVDGQPLRYHYKKWLCPRCGLVDRDALIRTLEDYRLLIGTKLTNKSFCEFFAIDSPNLAYKLLQQLPLKAEGIKRHRKYWILD
ncbi:nuclease-related domain-containing protein [Lysinibacillus pakistanensis]|uniref:Nuclease-related domain-containing protein n=1 Tax=Lysinibacillus pakistanensis TaxID=759811 RepID=A0AAX3X0R6_9BACI|nr:nuclease-related domain-containing protein [Lysinibacillus pakistanensis]MDM5233077.1 nuclease-related domain-containing protein [Lysinibacillus pakistanensis]WHY48561.1 nuclease-related domain-containing protein [Lysinibacillus pakistanensis]WHY53574.1 nuclease-related domain-containing protein [Lysinibacillus pakistanensis]